MTLQLALDTLHGVPEAQRALYVEKDGRFHLDIQGRENWPKEKAALEAELHATRASERGAIMERLAVALKNGGATPAGCDLFHYHRQACSSRDGRGQAHRREIGPESGRLMRRRDAFGAVSL